MMVDEKTINAQKILQDIKLDSTVLRLELGMRPGIILTIGQFILDIGTSGMFQDYWMKGLVLFILFMKIFLLKQVSDTKNSSILPIAILVSEVTNSAISFLAFAYYTECLILYSQISALLFVYYQSHMFYNRKILVLFTLKQTAMWSTIMYFRYDEKKTSHLSIAIASLTVLALYLLITYCEYVKDIHLCKSKLEVEQMHSNLSSLVESISDIIIVINQSSVLRFANSAGRKALSRLTPKDYFSKAPYYRKTCQNEDSDKNIFDDIQNLFKKPQDSEVNFGIVQNEQKLTEWKAKTIEWNYELSVILCGRDVTDLVRIEKQSNENEYKNVLLRTVSHELRTPTSVVLSTTELIEQTAKLDKENLERLEIIKSSCNYQLCLINDLLDYAQMVSGCLKITKTLFSIRGLFVECTKIIKTQIKGQNISLELKNCNLPENFYSDPHRIKQVLLNLLSNAKKFTLKGKITLIGKFKDNKLIVKCKDTGIGISKDKLPLLFTAYGKIKDSLNINPQGAGLGLVISNMLVKELGGQGINVKSSLNKGSNFSFAIPNDDNVENSETDVPEENALVYMPTMIVKKVYDNCYILIVDDNYFNYLVISQALKKQGFECFYASNGQKAQEMVQERSFSCILMDCEMPLLNGWETTKIIRKLDGNMKFKIPIIAFTAYCDEVVSKKCFDAGMVDIIVKPCPADELVRKIQHWINHKD